MEKGKRNANQFTNETLCNVVMKSINVILPFMLIFMLHMFNAIILLT